MKHLNSERHGVSIDSGCRNGACQRCKLQCTSGDLPVEAQKGLSSAQKEQGQFLACLCKSKSDLKIKRPGTRQEFRQVVITGVDRLSTDLVRVRTTIPSDFKYRAGQYLTIRNLHGVERCYSLASVPETDPFLEFHIRHVPGGEMSSWFMSMVEVGEHLSVSEAIGDCFYTQDLSTSDLLMVCTGSGLAPLWGVARDALLNQHPGRIRLYHGVRDQSQLYYQKQLIELAEQNENFEYFGCASGDPGRSDILAGRSSDIALEQVGDLSGWAVFLCGNPDMVAATKKKAFLGGAALSDIRADSFFLTSHRELKSPVAT